MKRIGIEGIYLGGWATSRPRARSPRILAPTSRAIRFSQVPDEAAGQVRPLLTADRNQQSCGCR